ncbi:hypothetical protein Pla86_35810 [Planctomycetes bacterium Pla86]|uniref:Outer membrane protein beta-barrel domain-containing protein n=1 Tax=Engelhardtia mirabilis TaxID=2528011 RepID=A0A518BND4_9BACT|nr:hypothetical protein Pla133_35830 [Planctomycetes bacterium Pla133]QDV02810.1 hypothetical protein Pla86_35810 [Planctomycetes bacterium Pla86]
MATTALATGACRVPELQREPWHPLRGGSFALAVKPALFDDYTLEGDFVADTPGGLQQATDSGDVLGKFGVAVRADWHMTDRWSMGVGADLRKYVVRDLNPIDQLDIRVDDVQSLQYYWALRHQFQPFASSRRLRAYGQAILSWFPTTDIGFDVTTPIPDEPAIRIDTKGEPYWLGALGTGLLYQWDDHVLLELGVLREWALTPIEADLTVEFGPGGPGFEIPFEASLKPEGWIVFVGLSYTF